MTPRHRDAIARDWAVTSHNAVVTGSVRVADILVDVAGAGALIALRRLIALGRTTPTAFDRLNIPCVIASRADFTEVARMLAVGRTAASTS